LYDLDGFTVAGLTINSIRIRAPVLECVQVQEWPNCETVTSRVHSRRMTAVRDLPFRRPWVVREISAGCAATSAAALDGRSSNAARSWGRGSTAGAWVSVRHGGQPCAHRAAGARAVHAVMISEG